MTEISINHQLAESQIFELFKIQLKKDFESSGISAEFCDRLPKNLDDLVNTISRSLRNNAASVANLLYRVDISENVLKKTLQNEEAAQDFESVLALLIVKRILQKVVIRRNYSA